MDPQNIGSKSRPHIQWRRPDLQEVDNSVFIAQYSHDETNERLLNDISTLGHLHEAEGCQSLLQNVFDLRILGQIKTGEFERGDGLAAWVHDRTPSNEGYSYNGAMSMAQFWKLLMKSEGTQESGPGEVGIRRIYINSPGTCALGTLLLASSKHQTPHIGEFISKYLSGDMSIGIHTTDTGHYSLELHLPWCALRRNRPLHRDHRTMSNGDTLRGQIRLHLLESSNTHANRGTYLYESQTSIRVTGWNVSKWTATGLSDNYFDGEDPNDDSSIVFYKSDGESDEMIKMDALCLGSRTADKISHVEPRQYFLTVIAAHLDRVCNEWKVISSFISESILQFCQDANIRQQRHAKGQAHDQTMPFEDAKAFVNRNVTLLRNLTKKLKQTLDAWTAFSSVEGGRLMHQEDDATSEGLERCFFEVMEVMGRIQLCLVRLQNVEAHLRHFHSILLCRMVLAQSTSQIFNPITLGTRTGQAIYNQIESVFRSGDAIFRRAFGMEALSQLDALFSIQTDRKASRRDLPKEIAVAENSFETWKMEASPSPTRSLIESQGNGYILSNELASTKPSSTWTQTWLREHNEEYKTGGDVSGGFSDAFENFELNDEEIESLKSVDEDISCRERPTHIEPEVRWAAVDCIARLLSSDPELSQMYRDATRLLDHDKFLRNHGRLLKRYYLSLRPQARTHRQMMATDFLRPQIHRRLISSHIRLNTKAFERVEMTDLEAELPILSNWDETLEVHHGSITEPCDSQAEYFLDYAARDSDDSEALESKCEESSSENANPENVGKVLLSALKEARTFFSSSSSFGQFKDEFGKFLHPETVHVHEISFLTKCNWSSSYAAAKCVLERIRKMFMGGLPGQSDPGKLRYRCGCGKYIYLEVRRPSPQGIINFKERLIRDSCALGTLCQTTPKESSNIPVPPRAVYTPVQRTCSTNRRQISGSEGLTSRDGTLASTNTTSPPGSETSLGRAYQTPQFLLLCVNRKSLPELIQIDISAFNNDQFLFQQILEEYQRVRSNSEWKASLLLPAWLLVIINWLTTNLKRSRWRILQRVAEAFQKAQGICAIRIYKIDTGDFVRFQLIPVRENAIPGRFRCGEFPPSSEVRLGKYLYDPVPMDDVEIRSIPLWHLTQPGPHSDKFWITTFPKKLNIRLQRLPGADKPVIGWGIRINETLNWKDILLLLLAVVGSIGISLGIYSVIKSDDSSTFGLGAFLVAVVALYIPFQYQAWRDGLE